MVGEIGLVIFYIIVILFAFLLNEEPNQDYFSAFIISFFVIAFFYAMARLLIEELFF